MSEAIVSCSSIICSTQHRAVTTLSPRVYRVPSMDPPDLGLDLQQFTKHTIAFFSAEAVQQLQIINLSSIVFAAYTNLKYFQN